MKHFVITLMFLLAVAGCASGASVAAPYTDTIAQSIEAGKKVIDQRLQESEQKPGAADQVCFTHAETERMQKGLADAWSVIEHQTDTIIQCRADNESLRDKAVIGGYVIWIVGAIFALLSLGFLMQKIGSVFLGGR
jgi:uncharacterized protein YceK